MCVCERIDVLGHLEAGRFKIAKFGKVLTAQKRWRRNGHFMFRAGSIISLNGPISIFPNDF